jgi:hypothetical protein
MDIEEFVAKHWRICECKEDFDLCEDLWKVNLLRQKFDLLRQKFDLLRISNHLIEKSE